MSFPGGSAGKEYTCNVGDLGLISGLGRTPREGKDYPLQYSGLETSMDYTVIEFSRPEYWSVSSFPSPGALPNPGIRPKSPTLQVYSLPAEPQGK